MKRLWILTLFLLGSVSHSSSAFSIDLKRVKTPLESMLQQKINPKVVEEIIKEQNHNFSILTKYGSAPVPLFRFLDNEFYGEILIGHPGQKFNVVFDTLWSQIWVPSILCPSLSITCAFRHKYDGNKSSKGKNLHKKFSLPFNSRNLTGNLWSDLLHLGQENVTEQVFGAVSEIPWFMMFSMTDGIVGLGFQQDGQPLTLFENILKQKIVDEPIFSIYLNRDPSSKKGGTILFGGIDSKHYRGNFTTVNVELDILGRRWGFAMDKIQVDNVTACNSGCYAVVDTSINAIEGPGKDIDAINKRINALYFHFGRYIVDCGTIRSLPKVKFTFGNRDFILKGSDYVQQLRWDVATVCLSAFKKNVDNDDKVWFLGGAFIAKYYVTFNTTNFTIGFADVQL